MKSMKSMKALHGPKNHPEPPKTPNTPSEGPDHKNGPCVVVGGEGVVGCGVFLGGWWIGKYI